MSELTIEQRVAAGVEWLDSNRPGWVERIDLAELDMDSCYRCVLGQLFGNYWEAPFVDEPPLDMEELNAYARLTAPLGFTFALPLPLNPEDDTEEDLLTAEWRRVIESRRAE